LQRNLGRNAVVADRGPSPAVANDKVKTSAAVLRSVSPAVKVEPVVSSPVSIPQPKAADIVKVHGKGKDPVLQLLRDLPTPQRGVDKTKPRLPTFPPPPSNPDVKYDIRSARGGRGGQVTAVASLWASGAPLVDAKKPAKSDKTSDDRPAVKHLRSIAESPSKSFAGVDENKPTTQRPFDRQHLRPIAESPVSSSIPTPPPDPSSDLDNNHKARRVAPMIKSASVPAILSSSHAKPTLSSTASLARPTRPPGNHIPPAKLQDTTVSEARSQPHTPNSPALSKPPPPGDLAFGQARLRDLIRKYQGQAS
jgi:hypothetical protein